MVLVCKRQKKTIYMKSLLESLNIALFESKTVKSTVKDFFNWYFG